MDPLLWERCKLSHLGNIPQGLCWSRRILVATHLFHLDPHHCFFHFFSFLNCSTIYYFWQFSSPKLPEPFWGPKWHFFCIEWSRSYVSISVLIFVVNGCSPWMVTHICVHPNFFFTLLKNWKTKNTLLKTTRRCVGCVFFWNFWMCIFYPADFSLSCFEVVVRFSKCKF